MDFVQGHAGSHVIETLYEVLKHELIQSGYVVRDCSNIVLRQSGVASIYLPDFYNSDKTLKIDSRNILNVIM